MVQYEREVINMDNEELIEDTPVCYYCSADVEPDDVITDSAGNPSCNDCVVVCERCDSIVHTDDIYHVNGSVWCDDCRCNHSFYCDYCDEYYDDDRVSSYHFNGRTYCEDDISSVAEWCDECDEWYPNDEYCQNCGDDSESLIKDYSYKPTPMFVGAPKHGVYLGWELEADSPKHDRHKVAEYASPAFGDIAYLKHDSSISRGFEIVTHPIAHYMLREKELDNYWDTVEKLRTEYGMRSWDSELECGLHVHISRKGFSGALHQHMFLRLIYGNVDMMKRFAGRQTRYATFNDVWDMRPEYDRPVRNYTSKVRGGGDRNSAVNTYPEHTIEVRFFRGTMRKEGILACLDLVQAMVEYTRHLSSHDVRLGALNWDMFYEYVQDNNGLYPSAYARMPQVTSVSLKNRIKIDA